VVTKVLATIVARVRTERRLPVETSSIIKSHQLFPPRPRRAVNAFLVYKPILSYLPCRLLYLFLRWLIDTMV
jgi:hypothetical protein